MMCSDTIISSVYYNVIGSAIYPHQYAVETMVTSDLYSPVIGPATVHVIRKLFEHLLTMFVRFLKESGDQIRALIHSRS